MSLSYIPASIVQSEIILLGYIACSKPHAKQSLATIFDWGRHYKSCRFPYNLTLCIRTGAAKPGTLRFPVNSGVSIFTYSPHTIKCVFISSYIGSFGLKL